ncbi:hypothetical protein HMPREF1141_1333 [Clostridium sp. MSTE9]|nr:hypothetical protein HMPREF1141_1333 [Clostridium sp. MSTE9]
MIRYGEPGNADRTTPFAVIFNDSMGLHPAEPVEPVSSRFILSY